MTCLFFTSRKEVIRKTLLKVNSILTNEAGMKRQTKRKIPFLILLQRSILKFNTKLYLAFYLTIMIWRDTIEHAYPLIICQNLQTLKIILACRVNIGQNYGKK